MGYLEYDLWTEKFPYWAGFVVIIIVVGIIFINRGKKSSSEVETQKKLNYSIGLFAFMYAITRTFFLFSDIERDANDVSQLYFFYVYIAYMFSIIAMITILNIIENFLIKRTKKMLTKFSIAYLFVIIGLLLLSFWNNSILAIGRTMSTIYFFGTGMVIIILYLYLAAKSIGSIRRNALLSALGMIVLAIGLFLDSDSLTRAQLIPIQLPPFVALAGVLLMVYGNKQI
mgnify:FL=1